MVMDTRPLPTFFSAGRSLNIDINKTSIDLLPPFLKFDEQWISLMTDSFYNQSATCRVRLDMMLTSDMLQSVLAHKYIIRVVSASLHQFTN
ncbi:hypothetical protein J6590_005530 [Homalodisca vitripennis]|nr:hypothetical protein J6590_005530 [Homalodisca vitripennis]